MTEAHADLNWRCDAGAAVCLLVRGLIRRRPLALKIDCTQRSATICFKWLTRHRSGPKPLSVYDLQSRSRLLRQPQLVTPAGAALPAVPGSTVASAWPQTSLVEGIVSRLCRGFRCSGSNANSSCEWVVPDVVAVPFFPAVIARWAVSLSNVMRSLRASVSAIFWSRASYSDLPGHRPYWPLPRSEAIGNI